MIYQNDSVTISCKEKTKFTTDISILTGNVACDIFAGQSEPAFMIYPEV